MHGNQVLVAMFFKSCIFLKKVGFNYIFTTGYITLIKYYSFKAILTVDEIPVLKWPVWEKKETMNF